MNLMDHAGFDLDLIVAFDALMAQRHSGLTQPAMSAAPARLRKATGDELFAAEGPRPNAPSAGLDRTTARCAHHGKRRARSRQAGLSMVHSMQSV
jgi:hypothetical protein